MQPRWAAAIAALSLLVFAPAVRAADEKMQVSADRVAFVDFSKVDDKVKTGRDGAAFRIGARLKPVLERVARERSVTVVLDRSKALLILDGLDITGDITQRKPGSELLTRPIAPAILLFAYKKTIVEHGGTNFEPALQRVAANRGANIVLDRDEIVLGLTDLDITAAVISVLRGGATRKSLTPPATLKIMSIDRRAVLREALVGKDLRAQVDAERRNLERRGTGADPKRTETLRAALKQAEDATRAEVEQALGPILEGIMIEEHATVLLDAEGVVYAPPDRDMTRRVIAGLDKRMPRVMTAIARRMATIANQRDQ